ncbi:MAG: FAD:protein FMN transferase [Bacteroidales bacterium]
MNKKGYIASIIFVVIFIVAYLLRTGSGSVLPAVYQHNEGTIFGTLYHISYQSSEDLHADIKGELQRFDNSMSTFNKNSIISRINRNDSTVVPDEWFLRVYNKGEEISEITNGAFDMTVAPLVNAWGFGFKKSESVTPELIDSLRQFVGSDKVSLINGKIVKTDQRLMLDASAIAKGYACDVIGDLLRSKKVTNFMVEIGGEVTVAGKSQKGKCWRIGINKPVEDNSASQGELQDIISLCDGGMATSGNYRNFYYKDGKRFAHTIDPRTGYPIEHSLLSATVIGPDCMTADAFATAFMVLGLDKSMEIAESNPEIEAYFIYSTDEQKNAVRMTTGFEKYMSAKN